MTKPEPPNSGPVAEVPADRNLCRFSGHTCGGCCWGTNLSRDAVVKALRRQARAVAEWPGGGLPSKRDLSRHELRSRKWQDLLWAPLLLLPFIGSILGEWLHGRLACAFIIFEDEAETRVGCALHPSRWNGEDVRTATAFRWLNGFVCGARTFFCPGAEAFVSATDDECDELSGEAAGMDFYDYSNMAPGYSCTASRRTMLSQDS